MAFSAEPIQPIQIITLFVAVAVPGLTAIVAITKMSSRIDQKTDGHEKRISELEMEVHGLRGIVVEAANDIKWVKELMQGKRQRNL